MRFRSSGNLILLVAGAACATQSTRSAGPASTYSLLSPQPTLRRSRDLITHDELQSPDLAGVSVLDAVKLLRPEFLTVRGLQTMPNRFTDGESGKVHSSVDGGKVGPLAELSAIRASTVREIYFLDPAAAHQRFGGAAREGPVILVRIL